LPWARIFDCGLVTDDPALTGYEHALFPREGWPPLPMHPDARMTVMAVASAGPRGIEDIGFVPCRLRPDGRVQPVHAHGDEGREVVAYLDRCNTSQRLAGRIDGSRSWQVGGALALRVLPLRR
jgi:hypothetical protein